MAGERTRVLSPADQLDGKDVLLGSSSVVQDLFSF
jgi:hypothetical protein